MRSVLAWTLAAATGGLIVGGSGLELAYRYADPGRSPLGISLVGNLSALATAVVGLVLALRRPANPIGWILSLMGLISGISVAASGYATYGILVQPGTLPATEWTAWLGNWIARLASAFVLLTFLLFPTGRLLSPRWRPALLFPLLVAIGFILRAFIPGPMDFLGVVNPAGVDWIPQTVNDGGLGGLALIVGSLVACGSLAIRYRRAAAAERQQIKWLVLPLLALLLALVGTIATLATNAARGSTSTAIVSLLYAFAALALPVSIGVAVLRYRLYDIDILINRALVYGATSALIAASFFAGIVTLQALLRPLTGASEAAVAISTLASVALVQPLRRRIQRSIDRRFYRARYDAARTLDAFAETLRDEVDLEAVRAALLAAVRETVQPVHGSVWLR